MKCKQAEPVRLHLVSVIFNDPKVPFCNFDHTPLKQCFVSYTDDYIYCDFYFVLRYLFIIPALIGYFTSYWLYWYFSVMPIVSRDFTVYWYMGTGMLVS